LVEAEAFFDSISDAEIGVRVVFQRCRAHVSPPGMPSLAGR
jgi:hypothetical protein